MTFNLLNFYIKTAQLRQTYNFDFYNMNDLITEIKLKSFVDYTG